MWTITKDHLAEAGARPGTNANAIGLVGPHGATMTAEEIIRHPAAKAFRMLDDDRNLCYEGVYVGKGDGFQPLDNFGTPNAGCTIIQYREGGKWVDL